MILCYSDASLFGANIANIYQPPNELIDSYNVFIREISPIFEQFENNKNEVIIAGDFNIDLLKINDKQVIITLPTRLSNTHGTLIDNFLCKLS